VRTDAEERAAAELRELAARRAELEADVSALTTYVREQRARLTDELRSQLEWLKAPGRLSLPEPPVAVSLTSVPSDHTADDTPPPESEPVAEQRDASGPIALPGADEGGPPTQGMPVPVVDLEDDDDEEDVPSLRPPNSGRTIDVREVRSTHAALDSAAEGDPFLAELRRAVIEDDAPPAGGGGGTVLEQPDLVDEEIIPESRRPRRRRPAV
jgi:hypothetical protein